MIHVIAFGLAERAINSTLACDPTSRSHLMALSGKVLRLIIDKPAFKVDVLFCEDHLRFEPVSQSMFEPQGGVIQEPNCTLQVATPSHLMSLMRQSGNLPIKGDHRVPMQLKALMDEFQPDLLDRIEHIIGKSASSYTHLITQELLPVISPVLSSFKSLMTNTQSTTDTPFDDIISQKKQELLRLQADIDREKARLDTLKNQAN
ncbi:SCP2 sterol-binding domain-containing protein [Moraxella oculi]|uniref:SCP2 sterol-binding domain-containing protein n=1 Tax=Moraxella oculi TaxID=2940516 RepID=A0ABW8U9N9_9GAMM